MSSAPDRAAAGAALTTRSLPPAPAASIAVGAAAGRAGPAAQAAPTLPPGLDLDDFLRVARQSFVRIQAAWDAADLDALSRLATGPLLSDLREQLQARGAAPNRTDVLTLQARLLVFEELPEAWFASVEFSGLIREQSDAGAQPFRELWLLVRPKQAAIDEPTSGKGNPIVQGSGPTKGAGPRIGSAAQDPAADPPWHLAGVQSLT